MDKSILKMGDAIQELNNKIDEEIFTERERELLLSFNKQINDILNVMEVKIITEL